MSNMIKILAVSLNYKKKSAGGAGKSFLNILESLEISNDFELERLAFEFKSSYGRLINPVRLGHYAFIPKIISSVRKYKPNFIITQTAYSLPCIIAGLITKVPVLNIVRDTSPLCPKYTDIYKNGKPCVGFENKKICHDCIEHWRTVRILIGNKPPGWQYSLRATLSTIVFKLRYFSCKFRSNLFNKAKYHLVASEIMKRFLSRSINPEIIKIMNITPIERREKVELREKKNFLLFVIPSSIDASHKGLKFIKFLSKSIPPDFKLAIVGAKIDVDPRNSNIVNYGYLTRKELDEIYKTSLITLVPSIYNEAFGRIIIESIINKTLVISSPNCGANQFFKDKPFLTVVPVKVEAWKREIEKLIANPYRINDNDVDCVYSRFSLEKSRKDLLSLIKHPNKVPRN